MRLTSLPILASAAILAGALVSCSGRKEADPQAQALYDGASEAFLARDYSRATLLLDSLQKTFPSELGLQREAMALRPKVIEQATLLKISTNDSLVATDRLCLEKLRPEMMWVKNPRMIEGYWVSKSAYNPDFMNTTGLQGRVSEIGEFYIVSSMNPSSLHHTAVSLSDGASSVRTPDVTYDGESNYRISGSEVITFSPAQSDTIGKFAYSHADIPLTLQIRKTDPRTGQSPVGRIRLLPRHDRGPRPGGPATSSRSHPAGGPQPDCLHLIRRFGH